MDWYDYESGCLVTSPASGYQINEKIEDLERKVRILTRQNQELKDIIAKAVCENDSQGAYEKCNIAIHREESILKILKGEPEE